jgi:hypothetical protein
MTLQRTEVFVPLTAAPVSGENREFHVTVIPQTEQPQSFQSLEQAVPSATSVASPTKRLCEPRLSVQRDGDRVTSIRIQCTCGQVMDVACVYEEPAKQP